jgi:hypothetical protein
VGTFPSGFLVPSVFVLCIWQRLAASGPHQSDLYREAPSRRLRDLACTGLLTPEMREHLLRGILGRLPHSVVSRFALQGQHVFCLSVPQER